MSVIVKASDASPYTVFCKGSPEMVSSLSVPSSIPHNFSSQLKEFTKQGYRVIGLGMKVLDETEIKKVKKLDRENVECDLEFIGFIILENKLKPQTTGVIYTLKNANLKVVMITGKTYLKKYIFFVIYYYFKVIIFKLAFMLPKSVKWLIQINI